ncbi:MAG: glucosyltransferase domain-containing protein [Thermoanaerobaculia bacterium]
MIPYDIIPSNQGEPTIRIPTRRGRLFSLRELRLFACFMAVTAVAKGLALLPKYSIDDYYLLQIQPRVRIMIQQGRFGQALLVGLLRALRLDPGYCYVFFVVVAIATWALLALAVVRWWGLKRRGWLPIAAGCLIAVHPFTTEIFTFRTALGTSTLALTLFSLLLLPRRWPPRQIVAGTALFALTLSIYQVVLHFALMILLLGGACGIARYLAIGAKLGWSRRWAGLCTWDRIRRHRQTALATCIALGTGVYFLASRAVLAFSGFPAIARTQFLPVAGVGKRLAEVETLLQARLLLPDPLLSPLAQQLSLLLLVMAVGGLLARKAAWGPRRSALLTWAAVGLIAAGLIWSVGLILVLEEFWPVARVMSHIGVFWAGVLAVAWLVSGRWRRAVLAGAATLVILSFIGSDNRILDDQQRLNQRDAMTANRIVARLESLPRFREIETVAVKGGSWRFPQRIATADHDMNISAFGAEWSKVQLLNEISGYRWKWGPDELLAMPGKAETRLAEEYCRDVEPWPGPQSVAIQDRLAIVCLGPG